MFQNWLLVNKLGFETASYLAVNKLLTGQPVLRSPGGVRRCLNLRQKSTRGEDGKRLVWSGSEFEPWRVYSKLRRCKTGVSEHTVSGSWRDSENSEAV